MPHHHWIPSSYLSRFSENPKLGRRARLAIFDKKQNKYFYANAGDIAKKSKYYTLTAKELPDPDVLEKSWAGYEGNLPSSLDKLIDGSIDAIEWLHTIIPFVAGLFVRGPDFEARMKIRGKDVLESPEFMKYISADNTNWQRESEFQRIMGILTAAKWVVCEKMGPGPFITNDKGWCPVPVSLDLVPAIAVPLDTKHLLHIYPQKIGPIIYSKEGKWKPIIQYQKITPESDAIFYGMINAFSEYFVIGPTELSLNVMSKTKTPWSKSNEEYDIWTLGFSNLHEMTAHELLWHRISSAMTRSPNEEGPWDFAIELDRLIKLKRWIPRSITIPFGNPILPPSIIRDGNIIFACLYEVPGITSKRSSGQESFRINYNPELIRFLFPYSLFPSEMKARGLSRPKGWPDIFGHSWLHE
jgi:hypothetical protein